MCLSIPAKVLSIEGDKAKVSVGGAEYDASLQLIDNVKIGDYVLLHTGFAIQKLDEEEAMETIRLINELGEIDEQIRLDEEK